MEELDHLLIEVYWHILEKTKGNDFKQKDRNNVEGKGKVREGQVWSMHTLESSAKFLVTMWYVTLP